MSVSEEGSVMCETMIYIYIYVGWKRYVERMGDRRGVYRVLMGKPEGKRPLGRPTRRWEDNIKMDLQEVEAEEIFTTGNRSDI